MTFEDIVAITKPHNDKLIAEGVAAKAMASLAFIERELDTLRTLLEQADKVIFDQNGAGCVGVNADVEQLHQWAEEANERHLARVANRSFRT